MENLISKLNFYKLISYLVDRGIPTLPSPQQTFPGDSNRVQTKGGSTHARAPCIAPAGRLYSHLASKQDTTGPGQSPARGRFFLTFGRTGSAPDKCICPLGKILTYKNLIYLLDFPNCSALILRGESLRQDIKPTNP